MAAPAAQANTQAVRLTNDQFLKLTKPKTVRIPGASAAAYIDGQTSTYTLPNTGLLESLWCVLQGSITVAGTVTSGTWKNLPYPAPHSVIKNVQFGSNNAFYMRNMSGWGWYKWIRNRYGLDPLTFGSVGAFAVNNKLALGQSGTQIVAGANVAAGTFTFNLALPMPIAYNRTGEVGLIVLQQNSTLYSLTIQWGQLTGGIGATGGTNDFFNTLVGTSLVITATVTFTATMDYFEMVYQGIDNMIALFMSVSESVFPGLVQGENVIKLPVNDLYTILQLEVINNGVIVPVANLSNIYLTHSGAVYDVQEDYLINLARNFYLKEMIPVDSSIVFDMGLRRGFRSRRDTIDGLNNQQITDAQIRYTLNTAPTGVNQNMLILESLRAIRQG